MFCEWPVGTGPTAVEIIRPACQAPESTGIRTSKFPHGIKRLRWASYDESRDRRGFVKSEKHG